MISAAPGTSPAHPPHRGDQLGDRVLRGHRIIQHHRVQRPAGPALQHPGRGDHLPDRLEDPLRAIRARSRLRHNVNVVGWNPSWSIGSPHATFHRRSQRTAPSPPRRTDPATSATPAPRRSPHPAPRPAPPGREQVSEHPVREHLAADAQPETRTHCRPAPDAQPTPPCPTTHGRNRSTLHPPIIDQNRSQPADRHAALIRSPSRLRAGRPNPRTIRGSVTLHERWQAVDLRGGR